MRMFTPGFPPVFTDEHANEAPQVVGEKLHPVTAAAVAAREAAIAALPTVDEAMRIAREQAGIQILPQNAPQPLVDNATRTLSGGIVVDQNGATVPTGTTVSDPPAPANTDATPAPAASAETLQSGAGMPMSAGPGSVAGQASTAPLDIEALRAAALAKAVAADADLLK